MLVKRCDRCGAYYQNYSVLKGKRVPNAVRTINRDETNDGVMVYKTYDLCPECIIRFVGFMQMEVPDDV